MPSESQSQLLIKGRLVEVRAASESAPVVATSEAAYTLGNATSVISPEGNVEPQVANELGTLHEPYEAATHGDGNSAGSAGVGPEDPLQAVPPAPAAQEPPCGNFCYGCLKGPCSLGQHMLRGELDFCLCNVCASARNRSPEQGDIVAGLMFFKELFADGAVENTAPPQLQGQTAAHSARGTQHDASGPSMFEVGILNALLASDEAHLGGGYGAVVNAADHEANPVGLA